MLLKLDSSNLVHSYTNLYTAFQLNFKETCTNPSLMAGDKVESFLKSELKKKNALLFVLIDSEVSNLEASSKLAKDVEKIGASAILVGGSSATDQIEMAQVVKGIKKGLEIPIILFPGNVTGVVPDADAILFSSLMNSENPYFITQAQALGAPSVLKIWIRTTPNCLFGYRRWNISMVCWFSKRNSI